MGLNPLDIVAVKDCCGCAACANACPKSCIEMRPDEHGFLRPQFDNSICIHCDLCRKACPILGDKVYGVEPKIIACKNRNNEVRSASSSGGVFTSIAESIISCGGAVSAWIEICAESNWRCDATSQKGFECRHKGPIYGHTLPNRRFEKLLGKILQQSILFGGGMPRSSEPCNFPPLHQLFGNKSSGQGDIVPFP